MSTFRAKLRPPRRTLWLGCKVKEVEPKMSKASGRGYLHISFSNCPFFAIWHHVNQKWLREILLERDISWPDNAIPIRPGDLLNLDVRWELAPELGRKEMLYPRPNIELDSVVRLFL